MTLPMELALLWPQQKGQRVAIAAKAELQSSVITLSFKTKFSGFYISKTA